MLLAYRKIKIIASVFCKINKFAIFLINLLITMLLLKLRERRLYHPAGNILAPSQYKGQPRRVNVIGGR
jgi:hypothetical protein